MPEQSIIEYRQIEEYPNYMVGSDGSVWSDHSGQWKRLACGGRKTYLGVVLCNKHGQKYYRVHILILTAFVGPRPICMQARHLNGNCRDNESSNLVWGTAVENGEDREKHGTTLFGERHHNATLTDDIVIKARNLWADGVLLSTIASSLGVSKAAIHNAIIGNRWPHLPKAQKKRRAADRISYDCVARPRGAK